MNLQLSLLSIISTLGCTGSLEVPSSLSNNQSCYFGEWLLLSHHPANKKSRSERHREDLQLGVSQSPPEQMTSFPSAAARSSSDPDGLLCHSNEAFVCSGCHSQALEHKEGAAAVGSGSLWLFRSCGRFRSQLPVLQQVPCVKYTGIRFLGGGLKKGPVTSP